MPNHTWILNALENLTNYAEYHGFNELKRITLTAKLVARAEITHNREEDNSKSCEKDNYEAVMKLVCPELYNDL